MELCGTWIVNCLEFLLWALLPNDVIEWVALDDAIDNRFNGECLVYILIYDMLVQNSKCQ